MSDFWLGFAWGAGIMILGSWATLSRERTLRKELTALTDLQRETVREQRAYIEQLKSRIE